MTGREFMDSHLLYESIYGTEKKPRSTQQWEEFSFSNTQRFTQMGSQVPMAWVLVRGKNIPPNAIVAGECKRQPLYIARTFYEGGVYIGQAAAHLEKGASFAYLGREVHVDTYEVLVPLQQTIKYEVAEHHVLPSIPRITRAAHPAPTSIPRSVTTEPMVDPFMTQLVQKLRAVKIVMAVDDSSSMFGTLWNQARSALVGLVSIIENDVSAHGIDLCFLNHHTFETNIRSSRTIHNIFDTVSPQGVTPTGSKLNQLFNRYLPLVEDPTRNSPPIVIMVITDGVPTDEVEGVIVECARRQDQQRVPLRRFGVSFVQIGDDPEAADYLKELDDDISKRFGCRDMVEATPYDPITPVLTQEVFFKCVMRSIIPYYDSNLVEMSRPRSATSPHQMTSYGTPPMLPTPLSVPRSVTTELLIDVSATQLVQKLRAVKVVMVVDDSSSMLGTLWNQARSALVGLVSAIENDFTANGIDLCFLNHHTFETNIRDSRKIQSIFDTVIPQGVTPTGSKLKELFNRYLPLVEDPMRNSPPIVIMVITDGVPTDEVEGVIIECARRQDHQRVPLRRLGVSFVQIGNDPEAASFLRGLDDDISKRFGCRDMVDTTPYNPNTPELTQDVFIKCVLGSIDPYYDNLVEMPRPHSTVNKYQPMPSYQMPSYGSPMSPAFARMPGMSPLAN